MNTRKWLFAAIFAALTCVLTILVPIPTPIGYIHPGDGMVILSGVFFSTSLLFSLSAGLGSMLADMILGYWIYAPATLVIKAVSALIAGLVFRSLRKKTDKSGTFCTAIAGLLSGLCTVIGYFLYETFLYGFPVALAVVPTNLIQIAFGILLACLLFGPISRLPYYQE